MTIAFLPASGVAGEMKLNREQLLGLIQAFGRIHAAMLEGQPIPDLTGQPIEAIVNTRCFVQPELAGEASALQFQHPNYGPLGFVLPIDQAEELARLLNAQAAQSRTSRGGKPN